MTAPHLSPAQRNLLRKLINGTSAMQGAGRTSKAAAGPTFRALVQRELVREDLSVTDAGRAVFAPVKSVEATPC